MSIKQLVFLAKKHLNMLSLVALFLLVVVSVMIILGNKNKVTPLAAKELVELSQNIHKYYQNRPDYWGLHSKIVIDQQIAPPSMIQNNELIGILKNKILIGNGINAHVLMPGARGFDIIYKDLSPKHCTNLASYNFNKQFWLGLTFVSITKDDKTTSFSWEDSPHKLPITKTAAKKACKKGGSIVWHFE